MGDISHPNITKKIITNPSNYIGSFILCKFETHLGFHES